MLYYRRDLFPSYWAEGGDVEASSIRDGHRFWQIPIGNTFIDLTADSGTLYLETLQGEVDTLRAAHW